MEVRSSTQVVKYKIIAALIFGIGFISLFLLLLRILISTPLSIPLSIFLVPGGMLIAILSRSRESNLALLVPVANALIYSGVVYVAVSIFWRNTSIATMQRVIARLAPPVAILLVLVCIPAFNPLWPRGMHELKRQETGLESALPLGMELNQSRAVLLSKGIQFREEAESSGGVVLEREDLKLAAAAGERVLSARFQTDASMFPCGYDMEIVLLFGRDDKLKQRYVHRLRVCP
jgi:hypothetical protein